MIKNVVILGASGSIGTQTIKVIEDNPNLFQLIGISVGENIARANELIQKHPEIKMCCVGNLNDVPKIVLKNTVFGSEGLKNLATYQEADIIVNALSGFIGLEPTLAAIKANKDIAIANKEALVCGGDLIWKELDKHHVNFSPIDSEHSAIWQCLTGEDINTVDKLIITASGGPFRNYTLEQLKDVTIEQALHHPTWKMGNKITVDSSTLVNKGLEVIEAHYLFHLPYEKITTVVHPESIVHSLVQFIDGSIKAQMGVPSMEIPIQYALCMGNRIEKHDQLLSFNQTLSLHFQPLDVDKFPAVKLAYHVGLMGGSAPTVYSVSNEIAVQAFLEKKISYLQIIEVIKKMVNEHKLVKEFTYEELLSIIEDTKVKAWQVCREIGGVK